MRTIGATWVTLKVSTSVEIHGEKKRIAYVSAYQSLEIGKDGVPPNIYTNKPFVVKLQRQLDRELLENFEINEEGPKCMLVYDYAKSVRGHALELENADAHHKVLDVMMAGEVREENRKMYRWAIRVGDYELDVCIDRDTDFGERDPCEWSLVESIVLGRTRSKRRY